MRDKQILLKQFFRVIYNTEIVTPGKFKDNQYVRVTDFKKVMFFNDVDELTQKALQWNRSQNLYFTLATTNGSDGTRDSLKKITVIGLDFDKKSQPNLDHKEIMGRFKRLGLFYHAIVNSGNGYHVYMAIEPTDNIEGVNEITKALQQRLGADADATNTTQILRVPFTLNCKDPKDKKPVNLIHVCDLSKVRRYSIDVLSKKFLTARNEYIQANGYSSNNVIESTNIPTCIRTIIDKGSLEGQRNADLQKIVVTLRQRNKVLNEIMNVANEWALKCTPIFSDRLEYQVNQIYDNLKYTKLDCEKCTTKDICKSYIESDFNLDGELITMSESQARCLKKSKRKGTKVMSGNDILILGILKNHSDGLTKMQIIEELSYTNNKTGIKTIAIGERLLKDVLKNLKQLGFVEVTQDKIPLYLAHEPRSLIELTYKISYGATYEAVKGTISTEELRLYNYMRYLQHVEQRENPKALKGNLFQITQRAIAKDLDLTQGRVSQMINNLLGEKIISIWHKEKSKNNGFEFNIYRLNY